MKRMYYVGPDVHKQSIYYCVKQGDGTEVRRGEVAARQPVLRQWAQETLSF